MPLTSHTNSIAGAAFEIVNKAERTACPTTPMSAPIDGELFPREKYEARTHIHHDQIREIAGAPFADCIPSPAESPPPYPPAHSYFSLQVVPPEQRPDETVLRSVRPTLKSSYYLKTTEGLRERALPRSRLGSVQRIHSPKGVAKFDNVACAAQGAPAQSFIVSLSINTARWKRQQQQHVLDQMPSPTAMLSHSECPTHLISLSLQNRKPLTYHILPGDGKDMHSARAKVGNLYIVVLAFLS